MDFEDIEQPAEDCRNDENRNRKCEIPSRYEVYPKCQPHGTEIYIILANFLYESVSACVFIG